MNRWKATKTRTIHYDTLEKAIKGMKLFVEANCPVCLTGPALPGGSYTVTVYGYTERNPK
jgi:hypothetical protein